MHENISKLGLGTVQFGTDYGISNKAGQTQKTEVEKILDTAGKEGVRYIDTAAAYGNAEQVLGQFDLSRFRVVSKFLPPEQGSSVEDHFGQSLKNLNLERLYAYLAHRPRSLLKKNGFWQALTNLKTKGLVQKIGYSLNAPEELDDLLQKGYFPDIIQVPFNYFDTRFQKQMVYLKGKSCEIHTRSTFLQGLFFMDPGELSSFFNEIKPDLVALQRKNNDIGKVLLNFALNQPYIDHVIIGVENNAQFLKNINSIDSAKPIAALQKAISGKILMPSNWPK